MTTEDVIKVYAEDNVGNKERYTQMAYTAIQGLLQPLLDDKDYLIPIPRKYQDGNYGKSLFKYLTNRNLITLMNGEDRDYYAFEEGSKKGFIDWWSQHWEEIQKKFESNGEEEENAAYDRVFETKAPINFPLAQDTVSGLRVMKKVNNMESIGASFEHYRIENGIREIPMSYWEADLDLKRHSMPDFRKRVHALAEAIRESGEIMPLIVAIDWGESEPYVLEGQHRLYALNLLGKKTFPAVVVIEE